MATLTKKRPPKAEELEMEGPDDDEVREGEDSAMPSRKRRARRSKAPMDSDCSCGKRKSKCDGSCGKKDGSYKPMMDRADALTPQEYLAACDLGIQGRSRSYIRARLDSEDRLDLKCGKGAIPEGKKCTKGAATRVQPKKGPGRIERRGLYGNSGLGGDPFSRRNMAKKGAMVNAAGLAALGGLVGGGKGAVVGGLAGAAAGALSGAGQAQLNRVTSRAAKRRRLNNEVNQRVGASFNKEKAGLQAQRAALKDKRREAFRSIRSERKQAYSQIKAGNYESAAASDKRVSKLKSNISSYDNKRKQLKGKIGEADARAVNRMVKGWDRVREKTKGKYGADSIWADGFTFDTQVVAV